MRMIDQNRLVPGGILTVLILVVFACGGQNGSQEQGSSALLIEGQDAQGSLLCILTP